MLSAKLEHMAKTENRPNLILRTAPTGVAAFNINGTTPHSLMNLPVPLPTGPYREVSGPALKRIQDKLGAVYFLIETRSQ